MLIIIALLTSAASYGAEVHIRPVSPRIEEIKKESVMREDILCSDVKSCMTCAISDEEKELFKQKFFSIKRYMFCKRCDKLYVFHPKKFLRTNDAFQ